MNILNTKLFLFIQQFATVVFRDFFTFVKFAKVRCHKFETKCNKVDQVIHAIPKNLVSKALAMKLCSSSSEFESNSTLFDLEPEVKLNLTTMKSREFYWLFVNKSYSEEQTGVKRWNKIVTMDKESWQSGGLRFS